MTAAHRDQVGVALFQVNKAIRQTQPVGKDLRHGRLVPLADGLRAGDQRNRAVWFEPDIDIFGRQAAGRLDVAGQPNAPAPPLRFAVTPAPRKIGQVGMRDRGIEMRRGSRHCRQRNSTRWSSALSRRNCAGADRSDRNHIAVPQRRSGAP